MSVDLRQCKIKLNREESQNAHNNDTKDSQCRFKGICLTLFLGQLLAGLLSAAGIFTALLTSTGFDLPLLQNFGHYSLLGLSGLLISLCRKPRQAPTVNSSLLVSSSSSSEYTSNIAYFVSHKYLMYLITAGLEVHAFWATLSAYAYTSVTSIQLVDCLSIPTSMVCSWLLLKSRFSWTHFAGAIICLIGATLMVATDTMTDRPSTLNNTSANREYLDEPLSWHTTAFGDMLAMIGAILFGISNVMQEYIIDAYGDANYLRIVGLTGATLSGIYCLIVDRTAIYELVTTGRLHKQTMSGSSLGYYLAFLMAQCALYLLMALTITEVSAVFINLSLLAADVYSLLAGILLFHVTFHYLYFVSFAIIIVGVGLFAYKATRTMGSAKSNVYGLRKQDLSQDRCIKIFE